MKARRARCFGRWGGSCLCEALSLGCSINDALGSVHGLVDGTAVPVATYRYDVFGSRETLGGTTGTKFGFTGRVHDALDRNVYARARHYAAETGVWRSPDPLQAGENWYRYVNDRPTRYGDPLGLVPFVNPDCDSCVPGGVNLVNLGIWTLLSARALLEQRTIRHGFPMMVGAGWNNENGDGTGHYQTLSVNFDKEWPLNNIVVRSYLVDSEIECACDDNMAQFGRGVAGFAFDSNGEWAVTLAAATLRDGMGPSGKTGGVVPTLGHELSHVVTGTEHPELIGKATAVPLTSNLWWDRYPPNVYVNSLSEVVGYSVGALLGHNPLLLELPEYR